MALVGASIEFSPGSRYLSIPECDALSTVGKKKEPMVFRFNLPHVRILVYTAAHGPSSFLWLCVYAPYDPSRVFIRVTGATHFDPFVLSIEQRLYTSELN